jgi:arginine decarboxylase
MKKELHNQTPFFTELLKYAESDVVPLDVPGHKRGKMKNDLKEAVGEMVYRLDANAPKGLDNLSRPRGVIKEAEELMADALGADKAYFLIDGTTVGILTMIMAIVRAKEKIILPRNVHKSVINALILSGAIPIFITPDIDNGLGIANGISLKAVKEAINEHPDAKAVFVINPTYFGVVSDLQAIVDFAHENEMVVLVDEAHGSQFAFSPLLPLTAMEAGADISSTSIHKTAGSFTQSSVLLTKGERVDQRRIRSTLNMLQSTSPSSLLLASLDTARKSMVLYGEEEIERVIKLAEYAREQIDEIKGIQAIGPEYFDKKGCFGFDLTKIIVRVADLDVTGFEVYNFLRDEQHVQLELAETYLILAVLSAGTTKEDVDRFVVSLQALSEEYFEKHQKVKTIKFKYSFPQSVTRPRDAYHAPKKYMKFSDAVDEISAECVMIYPPGIPLVIPGEIISEDLIEAMEFYAESGSVILGDQDDGTVKVIDKDQWIKWSDYEDEV